MKPFAILFLLMLLSDSSFAQSQMPAQNDRGYRTAAVEETGTFLPVGPSGVQENSRWSAMGTNKPLSIQNDSSSACTQLYYSGYLASKSQLWQQTFDSLTLFIDSCPNNPNSIHAFQLITDAVVALNGPYGGNYRSTYLGWLESVLYLNTTNPEYFCQCAEQIAGVLPLPHDTLPGYQSRETNIALAIDYWLIHNATCDTPGLSQEYDRSRQTQLDQWSNDPGAYKLDTTLPQLDSIQQGLLELLEKHFLYASVPNPPPPTILSNATANPNPTGEGTVISFGISKEAYVKIELFDVLGHEVESRAGSADLREGLFEPGNRSVPLSLAGLPSGTYFVRILTAYGEVQSVKLVKE